MEKIVITGADGFLGSHLVRKFSAQGCEVYALVIPNSPIRGRIEDVANTHIIECDLNAWQDVEAQLPRQPMAFIHLAWAGVTPDARRDLELQSTNIGLTLSTVRLAAAIGAQRFILPGSTAEYATTPGLINGSTCPSPQNAYGCTKIALRYLAAELCRELEVPFIYVVITGIYAADRADNNVIYYAISQLLQGKKPSFTKLEQLWDYVYIDDVEQAFYLVACKGRADAFYTVGHGDNCPLADYIYKIRDIIDPSLPLGVGDVPYTGGVRPSSCVDLTALQQDTGFAPAVPFEEGIRKVIETVKRTMDKE